MDDVFLNPLKDKMIKALEIVRQDMATVRTGRANPQLIENVIIPAYGGSSRMRLKELATITSGDSRMLVVSPFDPTITQEIVKGIQEANIGLNPISEGKLIRITIPALTEERRQEYLKLVKAKAEGGKIMVRQVRHDAMSLLKRQNENDEVDEDTKSRIEKRIQELTDEMIVEVDALLKRKEEDLMKL